MSRLPEFENTIEHVAHSMARGEVTSGELVKRCLARIDEREPDLRAWVIVDRDGATAAAAQLDAEREAGGVRGPLHGIPVGIKDIVDVRGFPTAAGFPPLAERVVERDSEVVRRLRAAGAVILGKTVTTQFACYDPPRTRNPWSLDRTPGGSSSGSAAAVADGMCFAAIGSQTGGSITRPASFCGICGCKPTFGRVSRRGVVPISEHLDHVGPLARSVADLALILDAIAGFDFGDPYSADVGLPELSRSTGHELQGKPRLGVYRGGVFGRVDADARLALESALARWSSSGARVIDVTPPAGFDEISEHHRRVMAVEGAAFHERRFAEQGEHYLPGIRQLVEEGLSASPTEFARSLNHQQSLRREMLGGFAEIDAIVCPATFGAAPDASTTGDPGCNIPWSYTGLPVVSIPWEQNPDGLPLAIQLVGRPFGERELLATARWCEAARSPVSPQ